MRTFYSLHSFVRRNLALAERFVAAAGLALLLYALMRTVVVYPLYWDATLAAAIFFLTLVSPVAGYFAAVAAAAYPLCYVSLYLAVLFLAIAVLGQHMFINNLGATLLTFSSPLLGAVYLAWGIPLLGGLWWGAAGGALMGVCAALWGQVAAGMAGHSPDWMSLYGVLPVLAYLPEKFAQANSLEALYLLFLPLMPDSTYLLYCLLQAAVWAFVGWAAGMLSEKEWAVYRRPRSGMIIALVGSAALALLHIGLSLWLKIPPPPGVEYALGMTTLCSALAVMLLEWGADFLEHPLPLPGAERPARPIQIESAPAPQNPAPETEQIPPERPRESPADDEEEDLIMLELD